MFDKDDLSPHELVSMLSRIKSEISNATTFEDWSYAVGTLRLFNEAVRRRIEANQSAAHVFQSQI